MLGLSATIWFLIRVIPKPSRAAYPCMKAAAPLMSSFIIYLLGISVSFFSYKKFKASIQSSRYLLSMGFAILFLISLSVFVINDPKTALGSELKSIDSTFPVDSNDPIGTAIGLHPGRVVWMHDVDATNENYDPDNAGSQWWFHPNNTSQEVVSRMLEHGIREYAGTGTVQEAWTAIFTSFNESQGRGSKGYTEGEKIAIKLNITNSGGTSSERMNSTPQLVYALLDELINHAGVNPEDITIGDPYRDFRSEYWNTAGKFFPEVNYVDGDGGAGVSATVPSEEEVLKFSAGSASGNNGVSSTTLPQYYLDATYFINMPCLKTHDEGGITLIAKNHQGSFLGAGQEPKNQFAIDMHKSLPKNMMGQGNYRHTVDYMGHEQHHGKGLIYIIDGIWAGESWQGWISTFKSAPFNDDYANTLLIGQDPVALESVGFDILFEEYDTDQGKDPYPILYKNEVADYLMQCASSDYWPEGLQYDPEGDGSPMGSLGVFEHWNNASDRQYSRNLGTGNGIELKYVYGSISSAQSYMPQLEIEVAPNPFSEYVRFRLNEIEARQKKLDIFSMNGQHVNSLDFTPSGELSWDGSSTGGASLANGIYLYTISDPSGVLLSGKVSLAR